MLRRPSTGRDVFSPLLAVVAGHRLLGVVGCILDAFQDPRLVALPRVGEFFDGLLGRVGGLGEALRVARLSTTIWSALA